MVKRERRDRVRRDGWDKRYCQLWTFIGKKFPAARASRQAGFPHPLLQAVAETLLKQLNKEPVVNVAGTPQKRYSFAVVPYMHKVLHKLRKVAGKYGVDLVFSASCKLAQLCKCIMGSQDKFVVHQNICISVVHVPLWSCLFGTDRPVPERLATTTLQVLQIGRGVEYCSTMQKLRLLSVDEEYGSCRPWKNQIGMRAFGSGVNRKFWTW